MDPYFFYHQLYAFFFFPSYHSLLKKEIKIVYCIRPNKDLSSLVHNLPCGQQGRRKKQSGTDCISCNFIDLYLIIFFLFYFLQQQSFSKQIENFVGKTFTHTTYISVLPCHQSTIHSSLFSLQKTWLALQVIFNIYVHCVPMTQYHIFCFSLHFSILLMFFL